MMRMEDTALWVVGGDPDLHAVIQDAARRAFSPHATVIANDGRETLNPPAASRVFLLVLVDRDAAEEGKIIAMAGLRPGQCPIVRLGAPGHANAMEVVPPEEWNVPLLARVFRAAVEAHALARGQTRAQGDLLTVGRRISHDLRTPLGGILTAVEALQEVLAQENPSHVKLVHPISASANELMNLLERVSFVTRASAAPIAKTEIPMDEAVLAALEQLDGRVLRKHNATVSRPDTWPTVQGVAAWIQVVWWNLVANAAQHGGPAPKICIGWEQSHDECHFWVRDGGAGVPPEKRGRLFQPFHLLHELGSTRGLGLSIVQRLIELQGGRCGYESVPEGGACFFFTLPNAHKLERAAPAAIPSRPAELPTVAAIVASPATLLGLA